MNNDKYECYHCKGEKYTTIVINNQIYEALKYKIVCPVCKGTGELDWIENVMKRNIDDRMIFRSWNST